MSILDRLMEFRGRHYISWSVEDNQTVVDAFHMIRNHGWVRTSERRPDAGRLIVKRWKSGSVWAGVYSGTDKDSSFDEWCYLP